ncbi:MAG: long-chain fatty acid--CoA ligase [Eggerthellaceae bacterium]|nr:long-chain fatty acid--CoA ligase [Eggerthellaceae bacterium]
MNIADVIVESAQVHLGKVAIACDGRRFTYEELVGRVRRAAQALQHLGVSQGDHVALLADNSNAVLECVFACAWIGAVCEQYNTRLSICALDELMGRSPARVVVAGARFVESLDERFIEGPCGRPDALVQIGGEASFAQEASAECAVDDGAGCSSATGSLAAAALPAGKSKVPRYGYEALLGSCDPAPGPLSLPPESPCMQFFTSGTTGMPRGVVVSHEALVERWRIDAREQRFRADDVMLCVLPLFHVTSMGVYVALMVGATVVIERASDGAAVAAAVRKNAVTRTGLVPFLMRSLVDHMERHNVPLPSLEYVIYGGEPIDGPFLMRCHERMGCKLIQGYGMTETLSAITMLGPDDHGHPERVGTAGKVVPGFDLRIEAKDGHSCVAGERGEVLVRTPTLMLGYYGDPERTAEVMQDGWYRTGDIGYLDEDGYLMLVDRKNNLVITGGENVYPSEVMRCIRAMGDAVADVAVVGVPDDYWGESLAAFVVRSPGAQLDEEAVSAWCRERLGAYKRPRRVMFVDSLRRNPSGKIPKEYLHELTQSIQEESNG